ncbi:MAG: protein TolR [Thermodesulfobacteriota bacterium]|nr:protein TolR [Thermodesulfobacteriota bacterium]
MTNGGNQSRLMSDINVTPFVDVMLVLLIIFMVTAPMMMEGVNVTLPEATSKPLVSEKKPLIVNIDPENNIFINDFKVNVDGLGEKLNKILDGRKDREVYLKADKNISYGMVVRVMSEIKAAGVEKLGMVTIPISEKNRSGK